MDKQDIDIRMGAEFAPTVATRRHQQQRHRDQPGLLPNIFTRSFENMFEHQIHHVRPPVRDLRAARPGIVQHPQPALFDF